VLVGVHARTDTHTHRDRGIRPPVPMRANGTPLTQGESDTP